MVNKVILIGNVGADPEVRTFEDGSKVARINVATTERIFNPQTQERNDRTEWHRVVLWRGLAGVVEQYVRKGAQVYIEGRIRSNEWTDANGQKRYGIEILADSMNLLGRREQQQSQPYGQQNPYQQQGQQYGQSYQNPYQQQGQPYEQPQSPNGNNQQYNAPQQPLVNSTPPVSANNQNIDNMPEEEDDLPF